MCTQWYSKPIASGRLLNYLSFHPTSMKINIANNFIKRVQLLSSRTTDDQQKHTIFQYLRQNNYPSPLINRLIRHSYNNRAVSMTSTASTQEHPQGTPTNVQHPSSTQLTSPTTTEHPRSNDPSPVQTLGALTQHNDQERDVLMYRSMPNIQALTPALTAILKRDYPLVRIAPRMIKTTGSLLKTVKDPILPQQQHNVIYSIPCRDCEMVYIGMTTNQLKKRLNGHKSNINKLAEILQTTQHIHAKTALIQHIADHQHTFNLEGTKIIDRTYRSSALGMLEMCHINNTSHTVNYRTDVDGLHTTYAGILHTVRTNLSRREQSTHFSHDDSEQSSIGSI